MRDLRRPGRMSARSRLRKIVAAIDLPDDWAVEDFVAAVAAERGRPIDLQPLPPGTPPGICGYWWPFPDFDLILHLPSDDPDHVKNTVTHEIGHMLCDHPNDEKLTADELARVFTGITLPPGYDPSQIRAARGHTDYNDEHEYEAELLSRMIRTRAEKAPLQPGQTPRDRFLKAF